MINDHAKELTGEEWLKVARRAMIETFVSEPHHQNQNLAERRGGALKDNLQLLFYNTPWAPYRFWCYGLEFLAKIRRVIAQRSLGWRTGEEALFGETSDVSVFRFPWFAPVWYYVPTRKLPRYKMKPGYFLGVEENIGDAFTYKILPIEDISQLRGKLRHLSRSVVRLRDSTNSCAPIVQEDKDGVRFYDYDGNELVGDTTLKLINKSNENSYNDTVIDDLVVTVDNESNVDTIPPLNSAPITKVNTSTPPPFENCTNLNGIGNCVTQDDDDSLCSDENEDDAIVVPLKRKHSELVHVTGDCDRGVASKSRKVNDIDDDDIRCNVITQDVDSDAETLCDETMEDLSSDVNTHFVSIDEHEDDDIMEIVRHEWDGDDLLLHCRYHTDEIEVLPYDLVRVECPYRLAHYVTSREHSVKDRMVMRHGRWARHLLRKVRRVTRRLSKIFDCCKDDTSKEKKPRKKPGVNKRKQRKEKYGVTIPTKYSEAVQLDVSNGNTLWQTAVQIELAALIDHGCFEFKSKDYKPSSEYQFAPLRLVFELKQDLRRKARLVIQGFKVDPRDLSTRSTVVKGISVRLLDVIAHRDNLSILTGDIGNAFIQAPTQEKVYTICGKEWGDYYKRVAIIKKALYGLTTSAAQWRNLFADFLRKLGFKPTRYDRDVWLRMREDDEGYDYVCTHVDDFKIVAKAPNRWMHKIRSSFLVKSASAPDYYLGNEFRWDDRQKLWTYNCNKYVMEAVRKAEKIAGTIRYRRTPLPTGDIHPELDDSCLLTLKEHRHYQHLLGMGIWMVVIGRPDICFAVSSLSRFGAAPRSTHLELMFHVYGYLKKFPTKSIAVDSTDIDMSRLKEVEKLQCDFLKEYSDATEDMDNFPPPRGRPLQTTFLVDSDHAHDRRTRRSVTGIVGFVGSTPVLWSSKRQGAVASSTYAAEFMALRQGTEECINMRYMLRCLGVPVTNASYLFGDNLGVIQNSSNPESDIKKKHVAISYHMVREAIAAKIVFPYWIKGQFNLSDIMTKQIGGPEFRSLVDTIFWKPLFKG
jgi:hypothetical protein